ncbi:hypothetical protein E4U55_002610 [Claviceps digitariae]|nr:hypothetical protein E4U55_002610 [Claviceps digitariae]
MSAIFGAGRFMTISKRSFKTACLFESLSFVPQRSKSQVHFWKLLAATCLANDHGNEKFKGSSERHQSWYWTRHFADSQTQAIQAGRSRTKPRLLIVSGNCPPSLLSKCNDEMAKLQKTASSWWCSGASGVAAANHVHCSAGMPVLIGIITIIIIITGCPAQVPWIADAASNEIPMLERQQERQGERQQ